MNPLTPSKTAAKAADTTAPNAARTSRPTQNTLLQTAGGTDGATASPATPAAGNPAPAASATTDDTPPAPRPNSPTVDSADRAVRGTSAQAFSDEAARLQVQTPAVSVIMNCRNNAATLPETLESLRTQTFTDYEVIFWDNGSSDASPALAHAAAQHIPNFRYFRAEAPSPLGASRNRAMAVSRGEFLAFLDCDDLWLPDKLARQVALMRARPRVGLSCTDARCLLQGKLLPRTFFLRTHPEQGMVFDALMLRQWIVMSAAMLRRSALDSLGEDGVFDPALRVCEEADLFYRIAHDYECGHVDAPLTIWRNHGNNATMREFGRFAEETRYILHKFERIYPDFRQRHHEVVETLNRRAAVQEALARWHEGDGRAGRAALAGQRGKKAALVRLLTWLPPQLFTPLARLYWRFR